MKEFKYTGSVTFKSNNGKERLYLRGLVKRDIKEVGFFLGGIGVDLVINTKEEWCCTEKKYEDERRKR